MEKDELRRLAGPIDTTAGLLVVSGLFVWLSRRLPGTVSAYLAMNNEIALDPLFERLPGWRWVLPRVEEDGELTFRDRDLPRERHELGMDQPIEQGSVIPIHDLDVILVPGLAFDPSGGRLGRGGGYYDRVLAQRRTDSKAVGVTVSSRIVARVPVHDHDEDVDWLATEDGVKECRTQS